MPDPRIPKQLIVPLKRLHLRIPGTKDMPQPTSVYDMKISNESKLQHLREFNMESLHDLICEIGCYFREIQAIDKALKL